MPVQPIDITFAGLRVVAANPLKYPEAAGRANGYLCPLGPEPGIGYVLLTRGQWNELSYRTHLSSTLMMRSADRTVAIKSLYVINAIKVTPRAAEDDPTAVYLLKLADRRWHARMSDIEMQINVRCPAPPGTSGADLYYEDSLDEGNLYTWSTACEDIWAKIPNFGDYPGLPFFPNGDPEGFKFLGVPAIDALMTILRKIGCTIAYDPFEDVVDIVRLGIDQTGLQEKINKYSSYLRDSEPFGVRAAMVPEKIRVYFHAIGKHYGTEILTQRDSGNWLTENPAHHVDTPTNEEGAISGTVVALWDDLPAVYKFDGTLDNESALNSRAAERAASHLAELRADVNRFRRTYGGVIDIVPGTQVKAVHWRNVDSRTQVGEGLVTEVMEFPGELPMPDAAMRLGESTGGGCKPADEAIAPPDIARKTYLNYPPLIQLVAIDGSGGDLTAADGSNVWSGQVLRTDPGGDFSDDQDPYESLEECWVALANQLTGGDQEGMKLPAGDRYLARLSGSKTVGEDTRPLYVIIRGENVIFPVSLSGTVADGASTSVTLPDGRTVSATNKAGQELETGNATAYLDMLTSSWYLTGAAPGGRKFWKCTFNEDIEAGDTGEIVLSDTSIGTSGAVQATNWTFCHHAFQGRKGFAWKDLDDNYYFVTDGLRWFLASLSADLSREDLTASITSLVSLDGGSAGSGITGCDNHFGYSGVTGDSVLIVESPNAGSEKWVLVSITSRAHKPRWFKGALSAGLASSDAGASVDGIAALDGGEAPETATVKNPHSLAGLDDGDVLFCEDWDDLDEEDNPTYILVQVKHVAQTVVTDYRYDTSSHKLQKKTRVLAGMWNAVESDWTDVHTFTGYTAVTAVDWSSPNLTKKTRLLFCPEAGTESSATNVLTFEQITVATEVTYSDPSEYYKNRTCYVIGPGSVSSNITVWTGTDCEE